MAKAVNPAVGISKNRFNRFKLTLEEESGYLIGADVNADINIPDVKASIYKERDRWILMDIEDSGLTVNQQQLSSVELRENLDIRLGDYTVVYSADGVIKNSLGQISPIRIVILVLTLFLLLMFLFANNSSDPEAEIEDISLAKKTLQPIDDGAGVNTNATMNSQAFEFYNEALNTYDSGDLKKALVTMLDAASIEPENQLIQNKILDWESKIDAEISRLYKQACFDLEYFRYYEAEALLRIIIEMSVDEADIRYTQSVKILQQLSDSTTEKPECGS